ncbi:MAG: carboxypeptidase regulatory-like domain-containing protein [Gemmatimonadetes bacterium]|nr:carboxypeptidase regulatory-like domain-containing protein [Gemmatimonadota bacterium]
MSVRPAVLALAVLAATVRGQDVRGVVLDDATHTAIADAEVIINGGAASTRTSATGAFAFRVPMNGPHVLTIRRPGFRSLTTEAPVTAEVVEYALERVPTMLEEVAVRDSAVDPLARGKLYDFYQRRKMGIGTFLLRGVFDDARSPRTAEILGQRVPGLRVVSSPCGLQAFIATTRFSGSLTRTSQTQVCGRGLSPAICLVNVLLDGIMVFNGAPGQPAFDVNSLQPGEIAAVEYYGGPSRVPAGLNATSGACGLIGIWTR